MGSSRNVQTILIDGQGGGSGGLGSLLGMVSLAHEILAVLRRCRRASLCNSVMMSFL